MIRSLRLVEGRYVYLVDMLGFFGYPLELVLA
jgi:hypothetical protein